MNEIYLIRHTTPAVAKGICYGQTDLDVTESFFEEAEAIRRVLPAPFAAVYSSPLQRCARLAGVLFPGLPVMLRPELMELHCGSWEMQPWDDLPKDEVDPWMADFVNIRVPGGESYLDLHGRVTGCFNGIVTAGGHDGASADRDAASAGRDAAFVVRDAAFVVRDAASVVRDAASVGDSSDVGGPIAIVAHGGVLRSILAGITGTPLIDSFKVFSLYYGCVVRIRPRPAIAGFDYEILLNNKPEEREQHKPSSYYKKFT